MIGGVFLLARDPGALAEWYRRAFVWELFGSLLGAPQWTLNLTPFQHIGLVPAQPFRAAAAVTMLAIATAAGGGGVYSFARRDLTGN
jgi:ABC-2 type transport system permease protein